MFIPTALIIFGILALLSWLFSSGRIVVRRKPKIKLTQECKKYYDECERLLYPFYAENREIYTGILTNVESELDVLEQIYNQADLSTEAYAVAKYLLKEPVKDKYYACALDRVCCELKEIQNSSKGCVYASKEGFKKICNDLYEKRKELDKN